jgi:shikimate kinase
LWLVVTRRIAVVGVSGNGKTTFARRLAASLDVPYTELDALCSSARLGRGK